ncbi:MAG: MBL fold metallo-hydrolase [marine bacterium B5-7]|nr:MAG: MBL fold metallo-hydrolase [marine bacterium B5-7]
MKEEIFSHYDHGITCIDTGYIRPNMAAIYMVEHGDEVAIIETGTNHSLARVLALLDEKNIALSQVRYVIPTHIHLDHAGGAGRMMEMFPGAELIVHPRGARHLIDPTRLIKGVTEVYGQEKYDALYGDLIAVSKDRVVEAEDNMEFDLAGRMFLIRQTPGHAEHHICIWDEQSHGWFTGDTFGVSYQEMIGSEYRHIMPTTTPVQFAPEKLISSINLIMSYKPERIYLTHFGLLENPEYYAEKLCQRISYYCEIAQTNRNALNPIEKIEDTISGKECAQLNQIVPDIDLATAHELLEMDLNLNAQGLVVWLNQSG